MKHLDQDRITAMHEASDHMTDALNNMRVFDPDLSKEVDYWLAYSAYKHWYEKFVFLAANVRQTTEPIGHKHTSPPLPNYLHQAGSFQDGTGKFMVTNVKQEEA